MAGKVYTKRLAMEDFLSILQPPVKLFLQDVKQFSQQKNSFEACKSSFTRPVKTTGSPPIFVFTYLIYGVTKQ
jgi:hypothetical protein